MARKKEDPPSIGLIALILGMLVVLAVVCLFFAVLIVRNQRLATPASSQSGRAVAESPATGPVATASSRIPPGAFPAGGDYPPVRLDYQAYTSAFSAETRTPIWVSYRLVGNDKPDPPRPNAEFKADPRAPVLVTSSNYSNSGYDRGHMAPSDAIGRCFGLAAQIETFMTTNICPQDPGLNQRCWERFEHEELNEYAKTFGEVWVIDGPIFDGSCRRLASGVHVPNAFFKIVLARSDKSPKGKPAALAIVINNERTERSRIADYATPIREIESRTGLDFEPDMPGDEQNALETALPADPRWRLNDALNPEFPGEERAKRVFDCK